jgi:hypothetical protein
MFKFGDRIKHHTGATGTFLMQDKTCSNIHVRVDGCYYDDHTELGYNIWFPQYVSLIEETLELPTGLMVQQPVSPPWMTSKPVKEDTGVQAGPRYRSLPAGSKRKIGYEYRMLDSDTWCPGKIQSVGRVITRLSASLAEYRIPVRKKVKKEKGPRYKYYKEGQIVPAGEYQYKYPTQKVWVQSGVHPAKPWPMISGCAVRQLVK